MKPFPTLLAAFFCLTVARDGLADEVYIYSGVVKAEEFTGNTGVAQSRTLYVILDVTTTAFAYVIIDTKAKTYGTHNHSLTAWVTYPYSPQIDSRSRTFIYADEDQAPDSVTFTRLRSTAGPGLQTISTAASKLLPRSFAFSYSDRLSTASVTEITGTVSFHKILTMKSNDGGGSLFDALQIVLDYAQSKKQIN